jgi:hypothetical protein
MFDTFFTQGYKGCMLYTWSTADHEVFRRPAQSWRAAQIQITNYLKRKSKKSAQGGM